MVWVLGVLNLMIDIHMEMSREDLAEVSGVQMSGPDWTYELECQ